MVYCQRCGTKNDEDAKFCKNCRTSLTGTKSDIEKEWEDKCDKECSGKGRNAPIIWGIFVVLIGLVILFEVVLKKIEGLPQWVYDFEWWWLIALFIAIAIIYGGLKMMLQSGRTQ